MRLIDRLSDLLAAVAGWAYFVVGLMLTWEVVARYFFTAPTIWAEELSRLTFVWATLLAAPALLRRGQHVRVTVLTATLGARARRAARLVALAAVILFCGLIVYAGVEAPLSSLHRGRTTGTMLDLPAWWAQAAVPAAFALLGLQALIELGRTATGASLPPESGGEE